MKIKLKTPKQLANEANKIDYGLRHEEQPRITFWTYVIKGIRKEFKLIFRFGGGNGNNNNK